MVAAGNVSKTAEWISKFAMEGYQFSNGKTIQLSNQFHEIC
jgi:hypothetical protein